MTFQHCHDRFFFNSFHSTSTTPLQLKELGVESDSEDEDEDEDSDEGDGETEADEAGGPEDEVEDESPAAADLCRDEVEALRKQVEDSVVLWNKSRGDWFFFTLR